MDNGGVQALGGIVLDLSIITREILVGTQVISGTDMDLLKRLGVSGLLSLQEDDDLARVGAKWEVLEMAGRERGIDMRRIPIRDFDPPALISQLARCSDELAELIQENDRVYVHCTAGINRSTGVVLGYLVLRRKMRVQAAYKLIKNKRPQASPYRTLLEILGTEKRNDALGN